MFSNNSNSSSTIFNQLAKQIDAFRRFKLDVELDIKEKVAVYFQNICQNRNFKKIIFC